MTTETYQKVKQYLAGLDEGDFIYGDETNSSYSTESKASDLCISSLSDRPTPNLTLNRLTKPATPEVSHNPLRFISTKTSAEIFTQQAREQITQIEQQKKLREQFCVIEKESLVNRDEEIEWSATLEKWKNKRSSEIKKNLLAPSSFSARIQTNEVNHRSNKVIHGLKKVR